MFRNQEKVFKLLRNTFDLLTVRYMEFALDEYDRLSKYHGSGRDLIGKSLHYDEFMETKWCMVYDRLHNKIMHDLSIGLEKDYQCINGDD